MKETKNRRTETKKSKNRGTTMKENKFNEKFSRTNDEKL